MSATATQTQTHTAAPSTPLPYSPSSQEAPLRPWKFHLDEAGAIIIAVHIIAAASLFYYTPAAKTWWLTFVSWQLGNFGVTVGIHRLWSHRSYTASLPLRFALGIMATMAFQQRIYWWAMRHRLHHRYIDTDMDPYNAKKGFWYTHIGWVYEKVHYPKMKLIDRKDLDEDIVVQLNKKYFVPLSIFFCFVAPTILGATWGDALGGFLYGGCVARVAIWHCTWSLNSFAHLLGDQPYSTEHSAKGELIVAILTNGEGHHNYHHEFPNDYRNGVKAHHYDPSKWLIWAFAKLRLAHSLITIPDAEIAKAEIQTLEQHARRMRQIAEEEDRLLWGPELESLPVWTLAEMKRLVADEGRDLFVIDGLVLDFAAFTKRHPGGEKLLTAYRGKDATKAFYGPLNNHTKSARTLLRTMRIAKVAP
ncbi:hypothetical protein BDK51DRAFT_16122 [Blyttiomyces helicus]|uniref:Acyl-CoA desaturase n=1 Tax=Blyttiomyces helicus TaxID=388810 RepID=A0A4P9W000_9FUNG|nr:hypothetical protein BDK51DRAFT_16122 [Blyttiomyces helicus]|eukprot:RKO85374.1 hypothetical protein BDK51DRAFT_16122 [Blyttiomyces helicus]